MAGPRWASPIPTSAAARSVKDRRNTRSGNPLTRADAGIARFDPQERGIAQCSAGEARLRLTLHAQSFDWD